MRKQLSFAILATLAMGSANATIARLKALGMNETDMEGSYYINDSRNIFLNSANINNYADSLVLEWGSNGNVSGQENTSTNTDAAPKAQGGFLRKNGNYVYGLYVGNESNTSSMIRMVSSSAWAANGTDNNSPADGRLLDTADNQMDFFFGGDNGIKWGTNVVYTKSKDDSDKSKDHGYAVRLGAIASNWSGFANINLGAKAEKTVAATSVKDTTAVTQKFEGKLGLHVGGNYNLGHGKLYGFYKAFDWEQTDSAATTSGFSDAGSLGLNGRGQNGKVKAGFSSYALGYGCEHKDGAGTWFGNFEYRVKDIEVKFNNKAEANNKFVPFTVGYEYAATSWLTLRGSVTQKVWSQMTNKNYSSLNYYANQLAIQEFGADTNGKKTTMTNTTDVAAGATLNFKSLTVDGMIGTSGTNGTNSTTGDKGVLALDRLMARVGMTYNF